MAGNAIETAKQENWSRVYFELYLEQNTGGSRTVNSTITAFSGFMVRSA